MISFDIVTDDRFTEIAQGLSRSASHDLGIEEETVYAFVEGLLADFTETVDPEEEVAVCYYGECLLFRIYSEGYFFPCPLGLHGDADIGEALIALSDYTRRELIPLSLTDVPRELLDTLTDLFPHVDAAAYEDDEDSFFVRVCTECDMLETVPTLTEGELTLDALRPEDGEDYCRLSTDPEVNRYWGYDYSEDRPEADADYFLDVAEVEFNTGIALSFAVRQAGVFVGEAVIFDFDHRGSAMIAVRLLPERHGRGIGTATVRLLMRAAESIGLTLLRAEVMEKNVASIRMTERLMDRTGVTDGRVQFALAL